MGLLHLFCDRNCPWTLHVPKNETQARPSLVPKSSTCAIMIIACDNGVRECDNDSRMRLASSVCLGIVCRRTKCSSMFVVGGGGGGGGGAFFDPQAPCDPL